MAQKIRIRLKAYDHRVLDQAADKIVDTARRTNARTAGPIPLPTEISKLTVIRSPFIHTFVASAATSGGAERASIASTDSSAGTAIRSRCDNTEASNR